MIRLRCIKAAIFLHGVALLKGFDTPSLTAQGGQRRQLQKFNSDRDIPVHAHTEWASYFAAGYDADCSGNAHMADYGRYLHRYRRQPNVSFRPPSGPSTARNRVQASKR